MPKGVVMAALQIRRDDTPLDLRRRAARERERRAAMRLLALANALEGMTRAEAARLSGQNVLVRWARAAQAGPGPRM